MRDDLSKLPLPKSAKKYARMTSKDLGSNWSKKVDMYMDMAADLTNQSKEGFKNRDASGKVKHAFKESDDSLLRELGDVASLPILYDRVMKAVHNAYRQTTDPVTVVGDALAAVGVVGANGEHLRVSSTMSLPNFLTLHIADKSFAAVERLIRKYAPMADDIAVRVLMRVFQEEGDNIHHMCNDDDDLAEAIVSRLLGENDDLLNQMGNVANSPQEDYRLAREALNFVFGEGQGMVAAIGAALETVGAVGNDGPIIVKGGETLADLISVYLSDVDTEREVEGSLSAIQKLLDKYARKTIGDGAVWALMKIFREEAEGILDAAETYKQEMEDEIGAGEEDPNEVIQTTDRVVDENVDYGHAHCHALTAANQKRNPRGEAFGLFDKRYADEIVHSAFRLPDTETLVDNFGKHTGREEWEKVKHNFDGSANLEWRPITDERLKSLVVGGHRSIRKAGAAARQMENYGETYRYETNCVSANGDDITDMVDTAVDVTYEEFMRTVPIDQLFVAGIGYDYYWTPAQAIRAGVEWHEVARNKPLTLKKDWHVTYHRSTYQGKPCYFICHSAIEYVFVKA